MARKDRTDGRLPHQLPPGRHGLPRSFVIQNQRERILAAVADVTSAASYAEMTIEDIVGCAGVSRRTFYEHFSNKHDAFIAAYDAAASQLLEAVRKAVDEADGLEPKVAAGLGAFLELIATDPAFARMCIVEVLGAGPEAMARRNAAMEAFGELIQRNAREVVEGEDLPPELMTETIVGGIYEVVLARVLRGEIRTLPDLLPDLAYAAILPFLGREAAAGERRRLTDARAASAAAG